MERPWLRPSKDIQIPNIVLLAGTWQTRKEVPKLDRDVFFFSMDVNSVQVILRTVVLRRRAVPGRWWQKWTITLHPHQKDHVHKWIPSGSGPPL